MATQKAKSARLEKGRQLEVKHLVETMHISPKQARELLAKYGNDWERIRKEAEIFRAER